MEISSIYLFKKKIAYSCFILINCLYLQRLSENGINNLVQTSIDILIVSRKNNCFINLKKEKLMKLRLTFTTAFLFCTLAISAQVSIGSDLAPAKGALLDIKQQAGNITATSGGLLLPRVGLTTINSLAPLINNPTTTDNSDHKGLTVYNVTSNATFKPGIYVWDGAKWSIIKEGAGADFFYLPPFNLPLGNVVNATLTHNLYAEYAKQFTKDANNTRYVSSEASLTQIPGTYDSSKFIYVVPWYDNTVITVNNISAAGVLNYTVLKTTPPDGSFITVVLVPKP
jgi:hypothetical protein